ncbi:MAG: hypothetical protein WCK34_00190 [Bacteroidota bacterium]
MKTQRVILATLVFSLFLIYSCTPPRRLDYNYKTECLGVKLDGSQTLKAWGKGRNRTEAIEQAKKNAVRDVLFTGISSGKSDCNMRPVIFEVNAQQTHEEYFNKFFADGGPYQKFVFDDDHIRYHERKQVGAQKLYGLVVRVLRQDLVTEMKTAGLVK